MKNEKMYNVIFPIWFIILFPLYWFLILPINFIIDSIVLLIVLKFLKLDISIYKKTIMKVWIFGFLADIIGSLFVFLINLLPIDIFNNIYWNPYENLFSFLLMLISFGLSMYLIYLFNRKISFKKIDMDSKLKNKIAIFLAIFTAPFLFLIPTKVFYNYSTIDQKDIAFNNVLNKESININI